MKELKDHNHDTCDPVARGLPWFESKKAAEEYIRGNAAATAFGHRAHKCNGPRCNGWFTATMI